MQEKSRYTAEETARIQREINARLLRNRRVVLISLVIFGIFCISAGTIVYFAPADYKNSLIWAFIILFLITILVVNKFYPGIKCPGCQMLLSDQTFGDYCPVCAGSSLRVNEGGRRAYCPGCSRKLKYTVNRTLNLVRANFKIRACTHCGVHLSRSGI